MIVLVPGVPLQAIDIPYVGTIFNDDHSKFTSREHRMSSWRALGGKATSIYSALSSPDVWWFSMVAHDVHDLSTHATTILNLKDNDSEDKDDSKGTIVDDEDHNDTENKCSNEIDTSKDKNNTSKNGVNDNGHDDNDKGSHNNKTTSIMITNIISLCGDNVTADEHHQFTTITKTQSPSYYTLSYWVYNDIMTHLNYDNNTLAVVLVNGLVYILSFTIMGHLFTDIGRYAWMVFLWKFIVVVPVMLGIWTDTGVDAFNIDTTTTTSLRIAETDKDIGNTISSLLGLRSVLLQLIPATTILSLYVQSTAIAPIYVTSQKLLGIIIIMIIMIISLSLSSL